jgi:hypothetical protein
MLGSRLAPTRAPPSIPWQAAAERIAWEAVDHFASGGGRRRRTRTIEAATGVIVGKLVAGVVTLLFFVFVVQVVVPKILASALKPQSQSQRSGVGPSPSVRPFVAESVAPATRLRGSAEISSAKRSQAERDAEVQRYLDRVPELTHYRYSPLDQNREPPADPAAAESGR